jgi:CheY-like chemotaxis protein
MAFKANEVNMTDLLEASSMAPRMLIADDDPAIVRLLSDRCEKIGFKVETATNGIQALIMARRSRPDILIVDVNMPEADGLSVCGRLLEPGGRPMEVIVITGSKDPMTFERCQSFGTFCGHKGPDFWKNISSSLAMAFPHMADRIKELEFRSIGIEVPTRPRVLLVDDDPDIGMFLSSRLSKCGVDMLRAADGVQGYQMACREAPSVIVSDYFMPNGDAHYLLTRLRSTPATANIPVFVMSGRRLNEKTEQDLKRQICGHAGAARIFMKSFDVNELFGALQTVCGFEKNHVE